MLPSFDFGTDLLGFITLHTGDDYIIHLFELLHPPNLVQNSKHLVIKTHTYTNRPKDEQMGMKHSIEWKLDKYIEVLSRHCFNSPAVILEILVPKSSRKLPSSR